MLSEQVKSKILGQAPEDVSDRRAVQRTRTLKKGEIFFLDSHSAIECVVLDVSDSGARLRPTDVKSCPNSFRLQCYEEQTKLCQVVWRGAKDLGVRFV